LRLQSLADFEAAKEQKDEADAHEANGESPAKDWWNGARY
jgi:hypothetical protein